jgi:hypothetical protein
MPEDLRKFGSILLKHTKIEKGLKAFVGTKQAPRFRIPKFPGQARHAYLTCPIPAAEQEHGAKKGVR